MRHGHGEAPRHLPRFVGIVWKQTKQTIKARAQNSRRYRMPPAIESPANHDSGRLGP
jgi:hypothetical protein